MTGGIIGTDGRYEDTIAGVGAGAAETVNVGLIVGSGGAGRNDLVLRVVKRSCTNDCASVLHKLLTHNASL